MTKYEYKSSAKRGPGSKAADTRPARARYNARAGWVINKKRRVERSSHGKWTYEADRSGLNGKMVRVAK